MKIHEYQAKDILRQFDVPVPREVGIPAAKSSAAADPSGDPSGGIDRYSSASYDCAVAPAAKRPRRCDADSEAPLQT